VTAYAARQVYIPNRINLRPVAGICLQMKFVCCRLTYGSTLHFSQNAWEGTGDPFRAFGLPDAIFPGAGRGLVWASPWPPPQWLS
jgi:hypothetical protein